MNPRFLRALVIFVLLTSATAIVKAGPLDIWHWRKPAATGNPFYGVGFGANKYVAVGERGSIVISPDAINWFAQESGTSLTLRSVCFGNGIFVAVGELGAILVSPDGLNWTRAFNSYFYDLNGISYGTGQFVAVGADGVILTSSDGFTWSRRTSGSFDLKSIAFGNNRFVAVGWSFNGTQSVALNSTDGTNWFSEATAIPGRLNSVCFGNGIFVTATTLWPSDFASIFQVSTDGYSWKPTESVYINQINAIAFGNGKFIALGGSENTFYPIFFESENAVTWTQKSLEVDLPQVPRAAIFGSEGFVAVCGAKQFFAQNGILLQPNGSSVWTEQGRQIAWNPTRIKYVQDRYFLFDYFGSQIGTSADGIFWSTQVLPTNALIADVAFDGEKFLAVGGTNVLVSSNAEAWSVVFTLTNATFSAVTWDGNHFVGVGLNISGKSVDGTNWVLIEVTNFSPDRIHFGAGKFLAQNSQNWYLPGFLYLSSDGISWETYTNPAALHSLTFADGVFIASAEDNRVLISSNAIDWTTIRPASVNPIVAVSRINGRSLALVSINHYTGSNFYTLNRILSSNNDSAWTESDPGSSPSLFDIAAANNNVILLGSSGTLLQSDPLTPEPPSIVLTSRPVAARIGTTVTLRAFVQGTSPFQYQWFEDGHPIPGATFEYLTFHNVQLENSHAYSFSVSNLFGATNATFQLTVGAAPHLDLVRFPQLGIRISGTPARQYRIEYTADLANPLWQTLTNLALVGTNQTVTLDSDQPTSHFYRALLIP